jgi:hypothetical protein
LTIIVVPFQMFSEYWRGFEAQPFAHFARGLPDQFPFGAKLKAGETTGGVARDISFRIAEQSQFASRSLPRHG